MEPVPVYHAHNSTEATMVQHWLEEHGVPSRVIGGEMQAGVFDVIEADPIVIVAPEDLERAQAALEQFRQQLQSGMSLADLSDEEGQFDWPICPQCDELREATCQECDTTSSEFSTQTTDGGEEITCLACSQVVEISLADTCRFCMHDFTQVVTESNPTFGPSDAPVNNSRVMVVIAALVALAVLIGVWFLTSGGSG